MNNEYLTKTLSGERKLLRRFKKYKTLSPDDPLIKKDDYYLILLLNKKFIEQSNKEYIKEEDGTVRLTNFKYSITDKGLHYSQFMKENIKDFLFKSIFTPVIISVITTLITSKLIPLIFK